MDKMIKVKEDLKFIKIGQEVQIGQDIIFVKDIDFERGYVFYYDIVDYDEDDNPIIDDSCCGTKTWNDLRQKIIYE